MYGCVWHSVTGRTLCTLGLFTLCFCLECWNKNTQFYCSILPSEKEMWKHSEGLVWLSGSLAYLATPGLTGASKTQGTFQQGATVWQLRLSPCPLLPATVSYCSAGVQESKCKNNLFLTGNFVAGPTCWM